ncbi:hypothetical protein BKA67DRAFT_41819 [Truncatella angustata]|uniref:Uncharacterized protein n=1 Tax=Truncatella angustata TaxID=152316 RepID=A0A9P8UXG9_9PEZI|nr:uncharacterized protein BKA67DRAFT_41819 [Truncatella angustata]KAH6660147.1 hypothetical protein BKA67DRAFT_41819 [Truncatella angustata]KAH8202590.1 hypothetical protein TruAng_003191 [Truncatella angustata]
MASDATYDARPTVRRDSPSPDTAPSEAVGAQSLRVGRCVSTASTNSRGSSADGSYRDSLSSGAYSRQSSASYSRRSDVSFASSRNSTASFMGDRPSKRRGYTRPEGTDFAASAKQRESVLSLGSITHLQHFFARTGLLDGKGGQLARKRNPRATIDFSQLDLPTILTPNGSGENFDSSYADFGAQQEHLVESPIDEHDGFYDDEYDEPDPNILPPTTSTYKHRRVVSKPPTIAKLKADLVASLDSAARVLKEAILAQAAANDASHTTPDRLPGPGQGWYEIQGMQILDVMTLAIRAAKVYYTSHEHPERLDAIKSEKAIRYDLLAVMEVLKHMATRNFAGGMREDEHETMHAWVESIYTMLRKEQEMEEADRAERAGWTWLKGNWSGREIEREIAFLTSIDTEAEPLPVYTRIDPNGVVPTPFLESLQNGIRLVKLHNAAVRKSRRRFGAIGTFHTDTQKPYRCAENLRYWNKAAELRWEVVFKVDVLGIVYNSNTQVWIDFEEALWKWCRKVREEIAAELENDSLGG